MHEKQILEAGVKWNEASKVLVMIHGRGASAQDIISLSAYLNVKGYAIIAPQATGGTWYPNSFLAPPKTNEPWLGSAISLLGEIVNDINAAGISSRNIYFLGFSQGACLTLEFTTRFATRYGGVIAFTGGLIGDKIYEENYNGDFEGTPFFLGTSDPDPHVPVTRVNESVDILRKRNAFVTEKIYKNMGHTINQDEIEKVNKLIFV